MAITGRGSQGWKPLNKGIWEFLLCGDCEQHLNREFEQPFQNQWARDDALPKRMTKDDVHMATFDYSSFKLFHLSILFRASVSSNPMFRAVRLGVHEDRVRKMLLAQDAGYEWEYSILAFAVINSHNQVERRVITRPIAARYDGHRVYGQIYGGAMWWISASSHPNLTFCQGGLRQSGEMTFLAEPWDAIGVMQDASLALNASRRTTL
jgi:hypothetical protein